jgi:hypothetical protein
MSETETTTGLEDATEAYRLAVSAEADATKAVEEAQYALSRAQTLLARCECQTRSSAGRLLRIAGQA